MAAPGPVTLVARFRGAGWRYPLRPGDEVEVWRGTERLGYIPAELVIEVLQVYVLGARLTRRVQAALLAEMVEPVPVVEAAPVPLPDAGLPKPDTRPRLRGSTGRRLRGRKEAPHA